MKDFYIVAVLFVFTLLWLAISWSWYYIFKLQDSVKALQKSFVNADDLTIDPQAWFNYYADHDIGAGENPVVKKKRPARAKTTKRITPTKRKVTQ